ncbi:cyclase family protein [Citromicrobium bathyomarinum]|uniref:cyclase family protein n=1 Tax=Citromicrobium bathyomarinum TaxID=72174 RepID=UPI001E2A0009|nr:cyclase family protein [Citromicrobium bathyomarinum]MCD1623169.1 cyclase family protein [Citromicrobium bathyomarinum]
MELTHDAVEGCVFWPTADEFGLEEVADGETEGGRHYSASNIVTSAHGGTHRDAREHFADGGLLRIVAPLPRS